jgi:hypothetical protein
MNDATSRRTFDPCTRRRHEYEGWNGEFVIDVWSKNFGHIFRGNKAETLALAFFVRHVGDELTLISTRSTPDSTGVVEQRRGLGSRHCRSTDMHEREVL